MTVPYSAPCVADPLAPLGVGLAGEPARAHPRHVRLGHAQHRVDAGRPEAESDAGAGGDRVGAGHERVGAVVEVEQGRLRPLAQHHLALVQRAVHDQRGVGDERPDPLRVAQRGLGHHVLVDRALVVDLAQQHVLDRERGLDLLAQDLLVEQVLHADADPRGLVGVGGADAAAGGADLQPAQHQLGVGVDDAVPGHDQVRVSGDAEAGQVDAALLQAVQLLHQHLGVDHAAVADHAQGARPEDAARHQPQLVGVVAQHQRVAGVVAALVAGHHVGPLGQRVDDLALALVAPLGAHDDATRHRVPSLSGRALGEVGEARVAALVGQLHGVQGAVSVLADDQLGLALVLALGVVVVVAVDEHDQVGVLLDRAGLTQVGQLRPPVLGTALLDGARQLRQRQHRHLEVARDQLQLA